MKLGLTLGGGGARGGAHIGAIAELTALGIRPTLITGTSIGGLVGAMFGAAFSPEEMAESLHSFKPSALYALPSGGRSFTSAERVEALIENRLVKRFQQQIASRGSKRPTFADLSLPLALSTADLVTQHEVVLDEGDLIRALIASMSIPVLFPPVRYGPMRLVDGGLVNNLPIDVARSRGAIFTIAIDLSNSAPYNAAPAPTEPDTVFDVDWAQLFDGGLIDRAFYRATRRPLWQVVTAVTDIVNAQNTKLNLAVSPPDVLIQPYVDDIGLLDFHMVDKAIEAGRLAVHRAAPQLEQLLTRMKAMETAETELLSDD